MIVYTIYNIVNLPSVACHKLILCFCLRTDYPLSGQQGAQAVRYPVSGRRVEAPQWRVVKV